MHWLHFKPVDPTALPLDVIILELSSSMELGIVEGHGTDFRLAQAIKARSSKGPLSRCAFENLDRRQAGVRAHFVTTTERSTARSRVSHSNKYRNLRLSAVLCEAASLTATDVLAVSTAVTK